MNAIETKISNLFYSAVIHSPVYPVLFEDKQDVNIQLAPLLIEKVMLVDKLDKGSLKKQGNGITKTVDVSLFICKPMPFNDTNANLQDDINELESDIIAFINEMDKDSQIIETKDYDYDILTNFLDKGLLAYNLRFKMTLIGGFAFGC
jgi:hypothetical protein